MLNRIILMGRLTRDPELRYTQQGTPVAAFTLAVDRDSKDQNGERGVDFIDCVAWKGTAELMSKYFAKGRMAVVVGRLLLRDWTDRDGNKRRAAEVKVDQVYFGESKKADQPAPGYAPPAYGAPSGAGYDAQPGQFTEVDDDGELPF